MTHDSTAASAGQAAPAAGELTPPLLQPPYDYAPLKIDHRTGALTFTPDGARLPPGMRFVAPLDRFRYGYTVTDAEGRVAERHLVEMAREPRMPRPPGGRYARFGEAGARELLSVDLGSIREAGFWMRFEAFGKHNRAAVKRLLDAVADHFETPDGRAGFVHPVVTVDAAGLLHEQHGVLRFIRFSVVDWLHADGSTMLGGRAHG